MKYKVSWESDIVNDYRISLKKIVDQETLDDHIKYWRDVFNWKNFSPKYNPLDQYRDKAEYSESDKPYLELLVPIRLLYLQKLAKDFLVSTGLAYIQLHYVETGEYIGD